MPFGRHAWPRRPFILLAMILLLTAMPGLAALAGSPGSSSSLTLLAPAIVPAALGADEPALSPAYVPAEAALIFTIRPADLFAEPALAGFAQSLRPQHEALAGEFGVPLDHIEQVTFAFREVIPAGRPTVTVCVKEPGDALGLVRRYFANSVEQQHAGRKYRKAADGTAGCLLPPASRTVLLAESEEMLKTLLDAGENTELAAPLAARWAPVASAHAAVLVRIGKSGPSIEQMLNAGAGPALFMAVSPLWQNTENLSLGLSIDARARLAGTVACPAPDDAKKVADTLSAAITLGGNWMAGLGQIVGAQNPAAKKPVDDLRLLFENAIVERSDTQVTFTATCQTDTVAGSVSMLLTQMLGDVVRARTLQARNNLKMIALAMHNYHDVHARFPPAVLYGAGNTGKSKHPHSWRVAILPFIEQAPLYNEYNFDEPWDSPANKKVLEKMPAVFRDPTDPPGSTSASYFTFVGPGTMFGNEKGVQMREVIDGTSNTLLVVEARRDIPWTKPEDIPWDPEKAVPQPGGHYATGFLAVFGDGSVRMISNRVVEQVLRNLITMNDKNPIPPGEIPFEP